MKVTTTGIGMSVTRKFLITEDCPVIPMADARPPKDVRIDRGVIEYTWTDGGWKVRSDWAIELSGTVLKKDGTDSRNIHTRHPEDAYDWRVHDSGREWVAPEGYRWLESIVSLLRPNGDLSAADLYGHEVDR